MEKKAIVRIVSEDDSEYSCVCQVCGEERMMDNYGGHSGIKLIDERKLPFEIIGFWCSDKCFDVDVKRR